LTGDRAYSFISQQHASPLSPCATLTTASIACHHHHLRASSPLPPSCITVHHRRLPLFYTTSLYHSMRLFMSTTLFMIHQRNAPLCTPVSIIIVAPYRVSPPCSPPAIFQASHFIRNSTQHEEIKETPTDTTFAVHSSTAHCAKHPGHCS